MNGVHDMGGMQDMGPIEHEKNEPVFHARWEARAYALNRAMGAWGKWNIDASRHARELLRPADYLRMSYYESWVARLIELMVKHGFVTRAEIESGKPAPGSTRVTPPLTAGMVAENIRKGSPACEPKRHSRGAFQSRTESAGSQRPSNRSHTPASLCTRQNGYYRSGPWRLCLPGHECSLSR